MKLIFNSLYLILFIPIIATSCLNFGEDKTFENDSKELLKTLEWIMNKNLDSIINNTYLYENRKGIDPYYFAKFTLTDSSISKLIDSTWVKSNLPSKLYISTNAPTWYNPKINSKTKLYNMDFPGGSKSIIYNSLNKECFLQYSTH